MRDYKAMRDLRTFIRIIFQVFSILNKKQRWQALGMFFAILFGSIFELLGVSAMLPFVQSIMEPQQLMNKWYIAFFCKIFRVEKPQMVCLLVGIGIILIYLIKNLYLSVSAYWQAAYSNRIQKDLSILMLRSYMNRPYSFFLDHGSDVIMQGVNTDMFGVYSVILNGFKLLTELLIIVLVAIYLIIVDWMLAIGVLTIGLISLLVVIMGVKNKISKMALIYRESDRQQYKWVIQITHGIKDIFVYCRQHIFLNHFKVARQNTCKASTYYDFARALPERVIEALCISGIIGTVLFRLQMNLNVEEFVPKMAVFAMGAFRLLPSISRSAGYVSALVFYRPHVENAYNNITSARMNQKSEVDSFHEDKKLDRAITEKPIFCSEISIQNITWTYEGNERKVLDNLSLTIHKGEAIGIIGESGAGKTTLADILLHLYQPQSGRVLVDGVNIDEISQQWAGTIGFVPQTIFLVDDTIRENVLFGASEVSDEQVWNALYRASLDSFVRKLPQGLDTIVGEGGVKLSGGQRQRIAVARALYSNPQILVLDEATSALDNETEEAIMDAVDMLTGQITMVIIAHRITTLRNCNRIFEVIDGKAVERDKSIIVGRKD